ncbi:MAG: hypothetical protein JW870_09610 [Candidatus Delongbacteria bacterium]|nr:hypothetical protein [Candidatus Delongbacteria bacterium]
MKTIHETHEFEDIKYRKNTFVLAFNVYIQHNATMLSGYEMPVNINLN